MPFVSTPDGKVKCHLCGSSVPFKLATSQWHKLHRPWRFWIFRGRCKRA